MWRGFFTDVESRYLDIALVCERANDLKFADRAIRKAVKIKLDCQGEDSPDMQKYSMVAQRIKRQLEDESAVL